MKLHVLGLKSGAKELSGVTPQDTVDSLKKKLFDMQPTGQRLIHAGRTLVNGHELLSDAGISDGDVVVVLLTKSGASGKPGWEQRETNKPAPDLSAINKILERISSPAATAGGPVGPGGDPQAAAAQGAASLSVVENFPSLSIHSSTAVAAGMEGMG
eukprot:CAMPEP_0197611288 /NCGR_PEP_ID=MMETSP1326-20131121/55084_1 /TAXON_ID=1155430 /ORGANISM="Genus nov. species nov., Strain RCC2288" /LENGTH=156 /DNA_ID=CAMNT_0043179915 /DNA_START=94 /DNA_END=560 /DNA_ORIENTATION=-